MGDAASGVRRAARGRNRRGGPGRAEQPGTGAGTVKEILVSVEPLETRAAVIEDHKLAEFLVERPVSERVAGNIYKGRVENVLPGMDAAFVNVGLERNAFLYVGDTSAMWEREDLEDAAERPRSRPTIGEVLRSGQEVVVQVAKEPVGTKGARMTTNLALPGRYLVLMPTSGDVGVSRRIADEAERTRLRALADSIRPPGVGVIVRTVAEGRTEAQLVQDMEFLVRLWGRIEQRSQTAQAPALLHRDLGLVFRIVRDMMTEDVDRLVIDDRAEYERVLELCEIMSPDLKRRVRYWRPQRTALFDAFNLEGEIDKALRRKVWLKSGGTLVIDATEALTAIDVNTGKFVGTTDLKSTVFQTNMEACDEIARQIRLRDLSGIIVVDFIDMDDERDRQAVMARMEESVRRDRTRVHVLGFTALGLMEMTRKKTAAGLAAQLLRVCPDCDGRGRVLSEETMSHRIRREIKAVLRREAAEAILVEVHPQVAALLIGAGGANLRELERETGRSVFVRGSEALRIEQHAVKALGPREVVERIARPVSAGDTIDLRIQEPHVSNAADGIARIEGYVINVEGGARHVGERVRVTIVGAYRTYARARIIEPERPRPVAPEPS